MTNALSPVAAQSLVIEAREIAALTGHFTPNEIATALSIPPSDVLRRHALWDVLSQISVEDTDHDDYGWTLLPDARRDGLSAFYAKTHIDRADAVAPRPHKHDAFGRALRRLLTKREIALPMPGAKASDDSLHRSQRQFAEILDAAQFALVVPALDGRHYRVTGPLAKPTRMSLPRFIAFTKDQISRLQGRRNIAMVLPNGHHGYTGLRRRISAHLRGRSDDPRPQLLTGIGGAGKSALIARLLQGWSQTDSPVIPILLDFDRQQLSAGEPVEIVTEIIRQLSAGLSLHGDLGQEQRTSLEENLKDLRGEIALWKRDLQGNVETNLTQLSYLRSTLARFKQDWAAPLHARPIAVIFDTFEAVDRMLVHFDPTVEDAGELPLNPVIDQILSLESALRELAFPNLRSLFSGREPPVGKSTLLTHFSHHMRASGLTMQSGAKLLKDEDDSIAKERGKDPVLTDLAQREEVSRLLSGHPLALLVFARYAHQHAHDIEGLIKELDSEGGFGAELAQRFLYSRILGRIGDKEVRRLAHPGLVLRQLNSDMIRLVLAEPCLGIPPESLDSNRADDLMRRLSGEYWLVEPARGVLPLRHRPDLRELMVQGIFARPSDRDDPETAAKKEDLRRKATEVARNAARYFETGPRLDDPGKSLWVGMDPDFRKLEAQYYRSFLQSPKDNMDRDTARALDQHLGLDVETMPAQWRARIKDALDRPLSARELATLDEAQQEGARARAFKVAEQSGLSKFSQRDFEPAKAGKAAPELPNAMRKPTQSLADLNRHVGLSWATANFEAMHRIETYLRSFVGDQNEAQRAPSEIWRRPIYLVTLANAATGGQGPEVPAISEYELEQNSLAFAALRFIDGKRDAFYVDADPQLREEPDAVTANRRNAREFARQLRYGLSTNVPLEVAPAGMALAYVPNDLDLSTYHLMEEVDNRPGFFTQTIVSRLKNRTDVTVADIERSYRSSLDGVSLTTIDDFFGLSDDVLNWIARIYRGLTPELHEPGAALLRAATQDLALDAFLKCTEAAPIWPFDLKDLDPKQVSDRAETIVETADRCGVLRTLLQVLSTELPNARHALRILELVDEAFEPPV